MSATDAPTCTSPLLEVCARVVDRERMVVDIGHVTLGSMRPLGSPIKPIKMSATEAVSVTLRLMTLRNRIAYESDTAF